jgi:hypothetical protein
MDWKSGIIYVRIFMDANEIKIRPNIPDLSRLPASPIPIITHIALFTDQTHRAQWFQNNLQISQFLNFCLPITRQRNSLSFLSQTRASLPSPHPHYLRCLRRTRAETRLSSLAFSRCQTFIESLRSDSLLSLSRCQRLPVAWYLTVLMRGGESRV